MNIKENIYDNLGLIVAMGQNREIGYKNSLIWSIKEDLLFFKEITMGTYIIMGKNTYESMPKNLTGRTYIVLSRNDNFNLESPKIVHRNIDETLSFVSKNSNSQFWVVGGGAIYKQFIPFASIMHITQINDSFANADTFFPIYNSEEWYEQDGDICVEGNISYKHLLLKRK